jgi:hypothetical protein
MGNEIAFQEPTIVSEFISKDSDDFSRRFLQIIQSAQCRAKTAEAFFGLAAQNAPDNVSRLFFLQLANKKSLHRRIVEKIGLNAEVLSCPIEVKLRYLEHQSKMETGDSEEIVEHFIKLERRWN